ncbi:MAG: polysaccharide biosynthesis/export family protein [Vicinamibacterales bacterium]
MWYWLAAPVWIVCGVLAYGWALHDHLSRVGGVDRIDLRVALVIGLCGPVGLIGLTLARSRVGLRFIWPLSTRRYAILLPLLLLPAVGCAHTRSLTGIPPRAVLSAMEENLYHLGPEDVLTVTLDDGPAIEAVVRSDGYISLPRLRDVHVADLTPADVQIALDNTAASLDPAPVIALAVTQINSRKVYIVGQVLHPGVYPLRGPMTILQALALAGGFSEWAKTTRIVIARDTGDEWLTYYTFSYRNIEKRKRMHDLSLRPGDVVVVP